MVDKKTKTKGDSVSIFYQVENNKVKIMRRECPRCGRGVFMAQHKDRLSCGKCGFTEFSHKDGKRKQ